MLKGIPLTGASLGTALSTGHRMLTNPFNTHPTLISVGANIAQGSETVPRSVTPKL